MADAIMTNILDEVCVHCPRAQLQETVARFIGGRPEEAINSNEAMVRTLFQALGRDRRNALCGRIVARVYEIEAGQEAE